MEQQWHCPACACTGTAPHIAGAHCSGCYTVAGKLVCVEWLTDLETAASSPAESPADPETRTAPRSR